ncbi:hypothetical protein MKW92_000571, partial [Papaver armeniacum]
FSTAMTTSAVNPSCCQVHDIGLCDPLSLSDYHRCMKFCGSKCRGGECTTRTGAQRCGCYCH